jgi:hypothetical protein
VEGAVEELAARYGLDLDAVEDGSESEESESESEPEEEEEEEEVQPGPQEVQSGDS